MSKILSPVKNCNCLFNGKFLKCMHVVKDIVSGCMFCTFYRNIPNNRIREFK